MRPFEQLSRDRCCLFYAASEHVLERAPFLAVRGRSAQRQQKPRAQRRRNMMLASCDLMKPPRVLRHQPSYI
jgi:hypothetical protein